MRIFSLALVALILIGCESDEAKFQRLRSEKEHQCLLAESYETEARAADRKIESLEEYKYRMDVGYRPQDSVKIRQMDAAHAARAKASGVDTLITRWEKQVVACELATRKFDAFGR